MILLKTIKYIFDQELVINDDDGDDDHDDDVYLE
jgi:hypothetical protein